MLTNMLVSIHIIFSLLLLGSATTITVLNSISFQFNSVCLATFNKGHCHKAALKNQKTTKEMFINQKSPLHIIVCSVYTADARRHLALKVSMDA